MRRQGIRTIIALFIFLLGFAGEAASQAPYLHWVKGVAVDGSGFINQGFTAVDAGGNVYITGWFMDSPDFDPGPGTAILKSAGAFDVYVVKLDSVGHFIWARSFGGPAHDDPASIVTDAAGNVYITGEFTDTADFDPDSASTATLTANAQADVFVCKLDTHGAYVWAKGFGGANNDKGYSIAIDSAGNVYSTGSFSDTVDFDPGSGVANLTGGKSNAFVSKLDAAGNYVWARNFGSASGAVGGGIAVDNSGNVITTGLFTGTTDFDPDSTGIANRTAAGDHDAYISKLDRDGSYVWAKSFGGMGTDEGGGVKVDKEGAIYTTGAFRDIVDFDPGSGMFNISAAGGFGTYVSKLDSNGIYLWANGLSGSSAAVFSYGIELDSSRNVYVAGSFRGTVDFDPGGGVVNMTAGGGYSGFIFKTDMYGTYTWARKIDGPGNEFMVGLAVDPVGNVYSSGSFADSTDFDPGSGIALLKNPSSGVFILKWGNSRPSTEVGAIAKPHTQSDVSVFPQPTSGNLKIRCNNASLIGKEARLCDIQGRTLWSFLLQHLSEQNISGWPSGVYILRLPNGEAIQIIRE